MNLKKTSVWVKPWFFAVIIDQILVPSSVRILKQEISY